jgi:hypothetical protein
VLLEELAPAQVELVGLGVGLEAPGGAAIRRPSRLSVAR